MGVLELASLVKPTISLHRMPEDNEIWYTRNIIYLKKMVADWKLVAGAGLPYIRSLATVFGSIPTYKQCVKNASKQCKNA